MKSHINLILFSFLLAFFSNTINAQNETPEITEWINKNKKALKANDTASIIKSYKYLGNSYGELENMEKSNQYLKQGLIWSEKAKAYRETGIIYNLLANNASYSGNRPLAFKYYQKALKAFTQIKNLPKIAMIQMNIGTEYANIGDYPEAIIWELKALKTKEVSGETENLGYFYQKVGELFKETDIDKWAYYVQKAYKLTKIPDAVGPSTQVAIFNDFGGIAQKRKRYQEAHAWYDSMYILSKNLEYDLGMATALSNRSLILKDEKKYNLALTFILRSLQISKKTGRSYSIIIDNIHAASILLDLKRPDEAREFCTVALKLARNKNAYPEQVADAYRLLAEIEDATGHWKQAYIYQRAHHEAMDSIRNTEVENTIEKLEAKYQTAEKEKQIVKLDNENQQKNLHLTRIKLIISALILIMFIAAFSILLWNRKKRLLHLKHQAELKQKLLRSQMNPHFIFNTLNAINYFIQSNQGSIASDYLAQYAKLMRQILENSAVEYITLENEISFIKNYLMMEQLRFNKKFDYEVLVDATLTSKIVELPPMVSQPFIENSIEHGFREIKSGGKLVVTFTLKDKKLLLIVTDNGKGITACATPSDKEKRRSFAIDITRERLEVLGEKSDALKIETPVDNTGKGTRVTICIPHKISVD